MDRILKRKRKKSPKPPHQPAFPEEPTNIAAGSPVLRVAEDIHNRGGRYPNCSSGLTDWVNLTTAIDDGSSQVVLGDWGPGSRTSALLIGGIGHGNELPGECLTPCEWAQC